jgi:hypothetical protein
MSRSTHLVDSIYPAGANAFRRKRYRVYFVLAAFDVFAVSRY